MFTRLFPQFHPSEYQLELEPNRDDLIFTGNVSIAGNLPKASKTIQLHAKDLVISSATVNGDNAKTSHSEFDVLTLTTKETLAGKVEIALSFTGKIKSGAMHGVYESTFMHEGKKKQIIATQFESHHARECFPCIDEPEAKAVFKLTLITPAGEPALSNMPAVSQTETDGKLWSTFEPTPRMSTYLLAFAYGEMNSFTVKTKAGIDVSVWGSAAHPESHLHYAAEEGTRVLDFFTEYFQTSYPLTKCDMVALPDFDAGAMENWGLVTYRELALLLDPDNASITSKQFVSLVIAHELSHQWFGNLVTMQWWDDLWLNESFASMMEHLALDALHPDWHQWEEYVSSDVVNTTNRDVFKDVQAVRTEVTNPDLIPTLFDPAIVYAKGGRLLKMLREFIGDDVFRQGLKSYFEVFAYQNTSRDDLWQHLSDASGIDVKAFMDPWLDQSGMPKVTIEQAGNQFTVSQQRFLLDDDDAESMWPVPLLASQGTGTKLLDSRSTSFETNELPVLNQHGSAHYIAHYSGEEAVESLLSLLKKGELKPEARIVLYNDQLLLSKSGEVSMPTLLDMVVNNRSEQRSSVLSLMNMVLAMARQLTSGSEVTDGNLKQIQAKIYAQSYKKLAWSADPSDTPDNLHLRTMAVSALLAAEDSEAVAKAHKLYDSHKDDLDRLQADLRTAILACAVRTHKDRDSVVANLLDVYEATSSSDLQHDICSALTSTNTAKDMSILIKRGIGRDGMVRPQDFVRWIAFLVGNKDTREGIWDFVEANWEYVKELMNQSKSYDYVPLYMARGLNTDAWLDRFKTFFEPKLDEPMLERNVKVAINDITSRVAWRKREEAEIVKWAEDNKPT